MSRLGSNRALLEVLKDLIEKYPDMRFSQILLNFYFVKAERPANPEQRISWQNEFYTESDEILKRVSRRLEDFKDDSNS